MQCSWSYGVVCLIWLMHIASTWSFLLLSPWSESSRVSDARAPLLASTAAVPPLVKQLDCYSALHESGWDKEIICLSKSSLPVVVEVQHKGRIQCCALLDFQFPARSSDTSMKKSPRFLIQPLWDGNYSSIAPTTTTTGTTPATDTSQSTSNIDCVLVDVGQLTNVWDQPRLSLHMLPKLRQQCATLGALPSRQVDRALTKLHKQCTQHRRKKASIRISTPFEGGSTNKPLPPLSETIDSNVLMQELQSQIRLTQDTTQQKNTHSIPALARRALIASAIGELGLGKFKRMPCRVLDVHLANEDPNGHAPSVANGNNDTEGFVVLLNGCWHSVSRSIVASTEGRASALSGAARNTQADQNILWKLEYLAMSTPSSSLSSDRGEDQTLLQPDVREFLKELGFTLDSLGARQALVELGIWSKDSQKRANNASFRQPTSTSTTTATSSPLPAVKIQPWSKQILEDVIWYKNMDKQRRTRFFQHLHQGHRPVDGKRVSGNWGALEGRTDLSHLPSVCVDAARATFRDDALGLRLRTETGRPVIGTNQWEVLIHVADVSDLYSTEIVRRSPQLQRLQDAAASRGGSRFDHSTGPIHMLPPALLEVLSLQTVAPGGNNTSIQAQGLNRCVSVWVYIDEKTGKLLDSGVERTLVVPPVALSFQHANILLEGNSTRAGEHLSLKRSRFVLTKVATLLDKWESHVTSRSRSAQERKEHALVSGMVAHEFDGSLQQSQAKDQEGREFELQRGYQVVDKALHLYGHIVSKSLTQSKTSLPFVAGTQDNGRVATAPLRRYVDGQAQRQVLATLCHYGGPPMSRHECSKVGIHATSIANGVSNLRPFKGKMHGSSQRQRKAIRALAHKIATTGSSTLAARSLGKRNEVVILGIGAVVKCDGLDGGGSDNESPPVETGQKVLVSIVDIDERKGLAVAKLLQVQ